jgi:adenylate cyclase class 2
MFYEVEQKFRVADLPALEQSLAALGASPGEAMVQVDTYFAHPARDFASTDEALRIRQVGDANCVTYKGPKIDTETKTRREIELPLAPGEAAALEFSELLMVLGFQEVASVHKTRRQVSIPWRGAHVIGAFDEVPPLGCFAELELTTEQDGLDAARAAIASLAAELGLHDSERRSYLELLLESRQDGQ